MGKGAKAKKKSDDENVGPDKDPAALLSSYVKTCQSIGLPPPPNDCIVKSLKDTENEHYGKQIVVDGQVNSSSDDDSALLGPGRCRALAVAISGRGHGLPMSEDGQPIVSSLLTDLRIWKSKIGDDGAIAIADMLRLGRPSLNLTFIELLDCKIEARGALALGKSLSCAVCKA